MRMPFLFVFMAFAAVLLYITSEKKIATLIINNGRPSLLFLKDCRYDAFYIESENGEILASLTYTEIPGHGPTFRENTFTSLEKLLDFNIKRNTVYNFSANTECLPNRQIPRKHFKFKVRDDGEIDVLEEN